MNYNILDFGAVGDGVTNDTSAIQKAINACSKTGGRVTLPGGRVYRCGALVLCSNLELHLEQGAVLKGSDNLGDYRLFGEGPSTPQKLEIPSYINCEYAGAPTHYFLYARDCTDLAITGLGTIDGNEEIFYGDMDKYHIEGLFYPRAPLLFLENVEHLTIRDVKLTRSAFWTVHMVGCRDVLIDGIRILNNLRLANCDGIDPDHCQNVRISNCHIECADDCIVFKNTAAAMKYGPCENITVTNCTLTTTSAAIKFGSESEALFRNILVENCAISRSNRGISLQLRDKGSIENAVFHNIAIDTRLFWPEVYWGRAEPIAITVLKRKTDTQVGTVKNIQFSNIVCTSENGILLYGEEEHAIQNIRFRDVSLHLRSSTRYPKGDHDLRPCTGSTLTPKKLSYVYARNADHVHFHGCSFTAEGLMEEELSADLHSDGCSDITF